MATKRFSARISYLGPGSSSRKGLGRTAVSEELDGLWGVYIRSIFFAKLFSIAMFSMSSLITQHHHHHHHRFRIWSRPCGRPRGPARCRVRSCRTKPCRPWKRSRAGVMSVGLVYGCGGNTIRVRVLTCLSGSMLAKPPLWLAWPPLDAISLTSSLGLATRVNNCTTR